MHKQPQPTVEPSISTAACVYLVVAGIATTALAGSIAVELFTPLDVKRGVSAFLAAVIAVAGYGYQVRAAEGRLGRRGAVAAALILDRLDSLDKRADGIEGRITEQGEAGYATGYVDGAAGGRHLTAVSQR